MPKRASERTHKYNTVNASLHWIVWLLPLGTLTTWQILGGNAVIRSISRSIFFFPLLGVLELWDISIYIVLNLPRADTDNLTYRIHYVGLVEGQGTLGTWIYLLPNYLYISMRQRVQLLSFYPNLNLTHNFKTTYFMIFSRIYGFVYYSLTFE